MSNDRESFTQSVKIIKSDKNRQRTDEKLVTLSLNLPERMEKILRSEAYRRNKSISAVAAYFLWSGYFVDRGDYIPPENPNK